MGSPAKHHVERSLCSLTFGIFFCDLRMYRSSLAIAGSICTLRCFRVSLGEPLGPQGSPCIPLGWPGWGLVGLPGPLRVAPLPFFGSQWGLEHSSVSFWAPRWIIVDLTRGLPGGQAFFLPALEASIYTVLALFSSLLDSIWCPCGHLLVSLCTPWRSFWRRWGPLGYLWAPSEALASLGCSFGGPFGAFFDVFLGNIRLFLGPCRPHVCEMISTTSE